MKKNCLLLIILLAMVLLAGCNPDPDTTYRVNYYGNGSNSGYAPVDPKEYKFGEEATVLGKNTLQKTGYEFLNWNTKSDGTGVSYSPGAKIKVNGAVFLYAIWE
jgi:ABC-type oligopeptide transport system substrate-binding subunit